MRDRLSSLGWKAFEMSIDNIEELRHVMRTAFPQTEFQGRVTPADGQPFSEELDDEFYLYQGLSGRRWAEVPEDFIKIHCGDLPLLTAEAFVTFLPAWIMSGLNEPGEKNPVLAFTIYSLSPADHPTNDAHVRSVMEQWWRSRVGLLTPEQLAAVLAFVDFVAENKATSRLRSDALRAREALSGLHR